MFSRRRSRRKDNPTPVNSISNNEVIEISSDENTRQFSPKDETVLQFLSEDQKRRKELESLKLRYMETSEKHPEYDRIWEKFYSNKCLELGANVRTDYIKEEWISYWKKYFFESHDRTVRESSNKLMNKMKLLRRHLADFEARHPGYMKRHFDRQVKETC